MTSIYVTVDDEVFEALKQTAAAHRVTIAALLRGAAKKVSDDFTDMEKLATCADIRLPGRTRAKASDAGSRIPRP